MKSTQKFLCYSLALVGAALIFSAGCKKGDNVINTTVVASQIPVLNTDGPQVSTGGASNTAAVTDTIASIGSSSVTTVGFHYTATAISFTGSTTPTYTGSVTAVVPTGTAGRGAFTATLYKAAMSSSLSGTIYAEGLLWKVSSFATNAAGTIRSAVTNTITTTN